ncbi:MAG TPA: chromate transporter [Ktedonobacteraceae bacterium]|nr:chromate transporter [Ktedonobacteraceae bacterium]
MPAPLLYFLLFFKASLFSTGGFSNLPSLRQDLLARHWATDATFAQSLAIGQITPGPNGLWVICLGYLTYGYLGAVLSLVALTIPPFLVLVNSAVYARIEKQRWVKGFMQGISLAVIGILFTVSWAIISRTSTDWRSWLIAIGAVVLALNKRINVVFILALAGAAGFLLYH